MRVARASAVSLRCVRSAVGRGLTSCRLPPAARRPPQPSARSDPHKVISKWNAPRLNLKMKMVRACEMEIVSEGRNFRLLQEEELPAILDFLEKHLPDSLKFHQTIKTYLNNRVWDFHFYVSRNWPREPVCLHFPGCTSTPNGRLYESVSVFCPSENLESIELFREEDILIDWTRPLFLNFTHSFIVDRIEEFYKEIGTLEKVHGDVYVCEETPITFNLDELPSDVEMCRLKPQHMKSIHNLYPANDMECVEIFEKLVAELPAYGIFSSGELAAWMVQSYYGAMFSMQTKPEYRRKGYGIHLAKYLTKEVTERGYKPFVVIRPENDASKSLYTKLGFKKNYQMIRAVLRPNNYEQNGTVTPGNGEIEPVD